MFISIGRTCSGLPLFSLGFGFVRRKKIVMSKAGTFPPPTEQAYILEVVTGSEALADHIKRYGPVRGSVGTLLFSVPFQGKLGVYVTQVYQYNSSITCDEEGRMWTWKTTQDWLVHARAVYLVHYYACYRVTNPDFVTSASDFWSPRETIFSHEEGYEQWSVGAYFRMLQKQYRNAQKRASES
jgi:hypothetical protein